MALNTPPNPPPNTPLRSRYREKKSWGWGALIAVLLVIGLVWWMWPDGSTDPVAEGPAVTAPAGTGVATDEPAAAPAGTDATTMPAPAGTPPVTQPAQ